MTGNHLTPNWTDFTDDELIAEMKRRGYRIEKAAIEPATSNDLMGAHATFGFEEFWAQYPRRVSKKEARKAWDRLNGDQRQQALDVIEAHVHMWIAEGRGTRLIPHASTWLNQWRFDDEIQFVPERAVGPAPDNRTTRSQSVLDNLENQ